MLNQEYENEIVKKTYKIVGLLQKILFLNHYHYLIDDNLVIYKSVMIMLFRYYFDILHLSTPSLFIFTFIFWGRFVPFCFC